MKKAFLIADSGGSKTDWVLHDSLGNTNSFTTDSYHPHLMSDEWVASKKGFWEEYIKIYDFEVHFYGSGCLQEKNKEIVKKSFQEWGIHKVNVQSDLIGAANACFGDKNGFIGILGTGSVIAEIENCSVKKLHGGFGYLLGDEGSGYYFGKLILQKYLHNQFSSKTLTEIENVLGTREFILATIYSVKSKKFIGDLSFLLSALNNEEITALHDENIKQFIQLYLPNEVKNKVISFVGSYAKINEETLRKHINAANWELGIIVEKPIELITEYLLKNTF